MVVYVLTSGGWLLHCEGLNLIFTNREVVQGKDCVIWETSGSLGQREEPGAEVVLAENVTNSENLFFLVDQQYNFLKEET